MIFLQAVLRSEEPVQFRPVLRTGQADEGERLVIADDTEGTSGAANREVQFYAIQSEEWPPGLAPVFAIQARGRFELRRLPPKGREPQFEPLFFGLSPEDGTPAVAGRWRGKASHQDGSSHHPVFDLAVEGTTLAGRFDPNTDYRFAFITEGAFTSNTISLVIEHNMDVYRMTGEWKRGELHGGWVKNSGEAAGRWEARRSMPDRAGVASSRIVPLHEWCREGTAGRRYRIGSDNAGPGWVRNPKPVCLVWIEPPAEKSPD